MTKIEALITEILKHFDGDANYGMEVESWGILFRNQIMESSLSLAECGICHHCNVSLVQK